MSEFPCGAVRGRMCILINLFWKHNLSGLLISIWIRRHLSSNLHSSLLFSISFLRALSLSHISQLKITGWKFDIKYNSLKKEKFQKWAFSSNKLYLLLIKRLSITCGEMTYGCSNFLGLDLFKKITLYPTNL